MLDGWTDGRADGRAGGRADGPPGSALLAALRCQHLVMCKGVQGWTDGRTLHCQHLTRCECGPDASRSWPMSFRNEFVVDAGSELLLAVSVQLQLQLQVQVQVTVDGEAEPTAGGRD